MSWLLCHSRSRPLPKLEATSFTDPSSTCPVVKLLRTRNYGTSCFCGMGGRKEKEKTRVGLLNIAA